MVSAISLNSFLSKQPDPNSTANAIEALDRLTPYLSQTDVPLRVLCMWICFCQRTLTFDVKKMNHCSCLLPNGGEETKTASTVRSRWSSQRTVRGSAVCCAIRLTDRLNMKFMIGKRCDPGALTSR